MTYVGTHKGHMIYAETDERGRLHYFVRVRVSDDVIGPVHSLHARIPLGVHGSLSEATGALDRRLEGGMDVETEG